MKAGNDGHTHNNVWNTNDFTKLESGALLTKIAGGFLLAQLKDFLSYCVPYRFTNYINKYN